MAAAEDACLYEEEVQKGEGSGVVLDVTDYLCSKRMSLRPGIGRNTLSPAEQCAHIKRPLELVKAAEWFCAQRSPFGVYKRPRQEMLPPFGFIFAEFPPILLVRLMFGCVSTACWRLVTAPAKMRTSERMMRRCALCVMDRVTQGRVSKVQVGCQW